MNEEQGFKYYWDLFWRYKYLVLLNLVVFVLLGTVFYMYEVPTYTSKSYLLVGRETVGETYDIGNVERTDVIITSAQSFSFLSNVVKELNLHAEPIKLSLIDRLFTLNSTKQLSFREMVFHVMENVNIRQETRSGIIRIAATSQDPVEAAKIADEIGKRIIKNNVDKKNETLQVSLSFIDSQMKSLEQLIRQNRERKEELDDSVIYGEIISLQEEIAEKERSLSSFERELEHLRVQSSISNESDKYEDRIDYIQGRIDELTKNIKDNKEKLRSLDKSVLYELNDLIFSISNNEKMYQNLLAEKQRLLLASLINVQDVRFLSRAYVPVNPDRMKGILIIFVFIGLGFASSFGLIQLIEMLNKKFKSSKEVEKILGLKVIGNVPRVKEKEKFKIIKPKKEPKSYVVESYRTLATNIKFASKGKVKSILFTSDKLGTGKSYTLANLAVIMANSGKKILMVDVDLRRPNLHKIFGAKRKPGLTEVLSGKAKLEESMVKIKENLYLLPSGSLSYNPQNVIESNQMEQLIQSFCDFYDFVFYDSIPLTTFSDVAILASKVDATLLVMDEKKSDKESMSVSKERLEEVNPNILGVVFNRKAKEHKYGYYYYSYRYHKK